jgi:flavin-dependent dehydrogenase
MVIVGAGIGGLRATRAAALARYEPVVFERSSADTAIGGGLLLWSSSSPRASPDWRSPPTQARAT